jgi:hypothetical protein
MKAISILLTLALLGFLFSQCSEPTPKGEHPVNTTSDAADNSKMSHGDQVKRGDYLVGILGCNDCHSPKMMTDHGPVVNPDLMLSGHPANETLAPIADKNILKGYALFNMSLTAAVGPWGTSYAANLTPDETGLGSWTIDNFEKALKHGKFKGMDNGRMLQPPMPWQNYINMSNDDLAAIWAYLQSIPAVKNIVPAPVPPSPM